MESTRKMIKRLEHAMKYDCLQAAERVMNELCRRESESFAVGEWNRLHMEIHPRWQQNVNNGN